MAECHGCGHKWSLKPVDTSFIDPPAAPPTEPPKPSQSQFWRHSKNIIGTFLLLFLIFFVYSNWSLFQGDIRCWYSKSAVLIGKPAFNPESGIIVWTSQVSQCGPKRAYFKIVGVDRHGQDVFKQAVSLDFSNSRAPQQTASFSLPGALRIQKVTVEPLQTHSLSYYGYKIYAALWELWVFTQRAVGWR